MHSQFTIMYRLTKRALVISSFVSSIFLKNPFFPSIQRSQQLSTNIYYLFKHDLKTARNASFHHLINYVFLWTKFALFQVLKYKNTLYDT